VGGGACKPTLIPAIIVITSSKPKAHGPTTNREKEKYDTKILLTDLQAPFTVSKHSSIALPVIKRSNTISLSMKNLSVVSMTSG
jgi:hypothetical protein